MFKFGKPQPWTEEALCLEIGNPDLWFAEKADHRSGLMAKAVCGACRVQASCLEAALAANEQFGVWGGLTLFERRELQRQRGVLRPSGNGGRLSGLGAGGCVGEAS
jgi:hypothetical protein